MPLRPPYQLPRNQAPKHANGHSRRNRHSAQVRPVPGSGPRQRRQKAADPAPSRFIGPRGWLSCAWTIQEITNGSVLHLGLPRLTLSRAGRDSPGQPTRGVHRSPATSGTPRSGTPRPATSGASRQRAPGPATSGRQQDAGTRSSDPFEMTFMSGQRGRAGAGGRTTGDLRLALDCGSADEDGQQEPDDGGAREEGVDAVQDAAVAGEEGAHVLDGEVALDH
jgi:hypothetical protein